MKKRIEITFSFDDIKNYFLEMLAKKGEKIDENFRRNSKMCFWTVDGKYNDIINSTDKVVLFYECEYDDDKGF